MYYYRFLLCCLLLTNSAVGMDIQRLLNSESYDDKKTKTALDLYLLSNTTLSATANQNISKIRERHKLYALCGGIYKSKATLKKHIKAHNTQSLKRKFYCFYCILNTLDMKTNITNNELKQFSFNQITLRKQHMENEHNITFTTTMRGYETNKLLCPSCKKSFNAGKRFIKHVTAHHTLN